jgi:hypothetical protein
MCYLTTFLTVDCSPAALRLQKKATAASGGLTPLRPAILMKNPD